ncbi:MAG: nucleoside hydrolase [Desulfobacterales bacterium]|nr:MAG: nucleoside hydrolase [Desulfobacterales bacterium]
MKQCIWMDVDTGVDDALAIMLALSTPALEVVGISSVSGNVSSVQAAQNTSFIIQHLWPQKRIPILAGASESLAGEAYHAAPEIHGPDGIGGVYESGRHSNFNSAAGSDQAVSAILEAVAAHPGELTLAACGPLTNIASAILTDPHTMGQLREIMMMAGALHRPGNITPFAEFNVFCDPTAAQTVLASGLPIRMFPLDVTERVPLMRSEIKRHAARCPRIADLIMRIIRFYVRFHRKNYGFDGVFMHDALPIAYLIHPGLFVFKDMHLGVDTSPGDTRGQTKPSTIAPAGPLVKAALEVDEQGLHTLFWQQLANP